MAKGHPANKWVIRPALRPFNLLSALTANKAQTAMKSRKTSVYLIQSHDLTSLCAYLTYAKTYAKT